MYWAFSKPKMKPSSSSSIIPHHFAFCAILNCTILCYLLYTEYCPHGAWWRHPCWPGRCQVCLRCSSSPDPSRGKYLVLTAAQVLRPALARVCGPWFVSRCWPWEPVLAQSHVFVIARIIFWFCSSKMLARRYMLMVRILNIHSQIMYLVQIGFPPLRSLHGNGEWMLPEQTTETIIISGPHRSTLGAKIESGR